MTRNDTAAVTWGSLAVAAVLTWLCVAAAGYILTEILLTGPYDHTRPRLERYILAIPTFLAHSIYVSWVPLIVVMPVLKYFFRKGLRSVGFGSAIGCVLGAATGFGLFGLGYMMMGGIIGTIYATVNMVILRLVVRGLVVGGRVVRGLVVRGRG